MRTLKFKVALGAFFGVLATSLADGVVSATEFSALAVSLVGAVLVFALPNASPEALEEVAGEIVDAAAPLGRTLDGQAKKHLS